MITSISGPVSLYIYNFQNKKYFLFGDIHFSRAGSCHSKGMKCDAFNYTFDKVIQYHEFFKMYLDVRPLLEIPRVKDNSCLYSKRLPLYLPADLYR